MELAKRPDYEAVEDFLCGNLFYTFHGNDSVVGTKFSLKCDLIDIDDDLFRVLHRFDQVALPFFRSDNMYHGLDLSNSVVINKTFSNKQDFKMNFTDHLRGFQISM